MEDTPATRVSLLVRIRDPQDIDAWKQFTDLYAGVIYGFARKRGLQDADAADLMQEVLRSVAMAAGKLDYDPKRGTFRGWLFTVTRNKISNYLSRERRHPRGTGDTDAQERLNELPNEETGEADWDNEFEQRTFAWATEQVRKEFQPATWQAFWRTAVEGRPAKEVGSELGMSPGAVYVAKSRVLARLKEQVQLIEEE